jgi:glycosyltransferase involved in cell wall biosynthesis
MEKTEVLVINDGSKDRSSEIAHSYQQKYPGTIRVINKENGNYGSCVNRGLKEATGKYIKILDADDWFDTENFAEFVSILGTLDVDCVMTDMVQVDEQGTEIARWKYSLPQNRLSSLKDITALPQEELIWMHCVAYKLQNLKGLNYHQTEGISYTDQEWIFLPMAVCKKIYYHPSVIYKYLVGRDGQTMNPETFKKNFGQEIRGTINMVHKYHAFNKSDHESLGYLEKRLLIRSTVCYGSYFEKFKMELFYDEMKELDDTLREEAAVLYYELANIHKIVMYKKKGRHNLFFPFSWLLLIWLWRRNG